MPKSIWIVEDDSDDRYLTEETLSALNINVPVRFLSGSSELFEMLASADEPSLILVDYNIAPDNGLAVLKELKQHEVYSKYPVVILSDTDLPRYKDECYQHGASSFIKKPNTLEGTHQKIGTFFKYWIEVAEA